jgi:hypothetical protein
MTGPMLQKRFILQAWSLNSGLSTCEHVLYCMNHAPTCFCLGYFGHQVSFFSQAGLDHDSFLCFPPLLG